MTKQYVRAIKGAAFSLDERGSKVHGKRRRERREFISGVFGSVRFCSYQSLEFQRTESSENILINFLLIFKANLII